MAAAKPTATMQRALIRGKLIRSSPIMATNRKKPPVLRRFSSLPTYIYAAMENSATTFFP